jgi:folylpolyglutamate synthase
LLSTSSKFGTGLKQTLRYVDTSEILLRIFEHVQRRLESTPAKPAYFRFVTLVAYHAFISMNVCIYSVYVLFNLNSAQVDATILEVGVGGRYDSTNIVPKPVVTGITALGIDHVAVLGKTLPEIAWQKAGIYKVRRCADDSPQTLTFPQEGVPALTVEQPDDAMTVLREEAAKVKVMHEGAHAAWINKSLLGIQL